MQALYPWQKSLWQQMFDLIEQDRLPHALLISGNVGIGKQHFARYLAQYLLCDRADSKVRDKNRALFDSADGHPDLIRVSPEGKLNVVKVDSIRDLTAKLSETALMDGYRVVIIDQAHKMNIAATNALLKTLEEPGENICIMLLSHEPEQLLPTIRSRCQQYSLIGDEAAKQWVAQQLLPSVNVDLLWQLSYQAPLQALAIQEGEWLAQRKLLLDGVLAKQDPIALASKLYQIADKQSVLNSLSSIVVDLTKLKAFADAPISNIDYAEQLQKQAVVLSQLQLDRLYDRYAQAKRDLAQQVSLNEQLLLEDWLIAFYEQVCKMP